MIPLIHILAFLMIKLQQLVCWCVCTFLYFLLRCFVFLWASLYCFNVSVLFLTLYLSSTFLIDMYLLQCLFWYVKSSNQNSVSFMLLTFVHVPLPPVCHLATRQITNTGVVCVFQHFSNDNNDKPDRNTCPFPTRQKD